MSNGVSFNGRSMPVSDGFAVRLGGAINDGSVNRQEMARLQGSIANDADREAYRLFAEAQQDGSTISIDIDGSGSIAPKEVSFPNVSRSAGVDAQGEPVTPDGRALPGEGDEAESDSALLVGARVQTTGGKPVATVGVAMADDDYSVAASVNSNGDVAAEGSVVITEGSPRNRGRAQSALGSVLGGTPRF